MDYHGLYSLTFHQKSIKNMFNRSPSHIPKSPVAIWKMAARAWLETAIPPVFGKEMESSERPIPQTRVSVFYYGVNE
jgi:hypothetical protein